MQLSLWYSDLVCNTAGCKANEISWIDEQSVEWLRTYIPNNKILGCAQQEREKLTWQRPRV